MGGPAPQLHRCLWPRPFFPFTCRLWSLIVLVGGYGDVPWCCLHSSWNCLHPPWFCRASSSQSASNTSFTIVTAFTLDPLWLQTETGLLGLSVGIQAISAYSARNGYGFEPVFTRLDTGHINWGRVHKTMQLFEDPAGSELRCASEWVVWMESDTWITNQTVLLEDIVAMAREDNPDPTVIVNKDYVGNLNTGVALIRCSEDGLALIHALIQCKDHNSTHHLVQAWDHNGCMMILHDQERFREFFAFVSPKSCNAYVSIDFENQLVQTCEPEECRKGLWEPGDFIVHFAGIYDKEKAMSYFLQSFPASNWP